ncbi:MAG: asparagine synthase (glutamine-hydrolyzing) [Bacteroidetes bacterium]|nr:asparagine synthase (glutamine-hydrolyzing) [Bacteroidota bacterium]
MCGILGIWARNKTGEVQFSHMPRALSRLNHRGPDYHACKTWSNVALGHTRLSIIDLSENANQPFTDESGNYHLVFNGEIYNYAAIRDQLKKNGISFSTQSDTEVLLKLLIHKGEQGLQDLNGFFAFVFFDASRNQLLAARDRFGIKPLLYSIEENQVIFSSELKPFLQFDINQSPDPDALTRFFSYTYIPAPLTVLESVKKMLPGQLMRIKGDKIEFENYYTVEKKPLYAGTFSAAKNELRERLTKSVERRLVADVPVGSFLSGGLDSSIIAMLAKQQRSDLKTFSIGFDHPYFNESAFAEEMAKHIGTRHETLVLNKSSFKAEFASFLDSLDEPFADSSAFAVYLLSKHTRKQIIVSLSGDGADELFGGYRKHLAEAKIRQSGLLKQLLVKGGAKILGKNSDSRSSRTGDLKRRIQKFAAGFDLNADERYHQWARWISETDCDRLLLKKGSLFSWPDTIHDLNDFLLRDQQFVLPNDMLKKVDQMSMAHALEVRVPFLDHELVEFANSLPADWKVNSGHTKLILREAFKNDLPESVLKRSKKGFEIPLQSWLNEEIDALFSADYFTRDYLIHQNLFHPEFIGAIKSDWKSGKIGERIYLVWALVVFQHWYHENMFRK